MNNLLSNFEQSLDKVYKKNSNLEEQYVSLKNKIDEKKLEINNLEMRLNMENTNLRDNEELLKNLTDEKEKKVNEKASNGIKELIKKLNEQIVKENSKLDKLKEIFNKKEQDLNKKYHDLIHDRGNIINELREYHQQWNEWFDENVKTVNFETLKKEIAQERKNIKKIFKEKSILLVEKNKIQKALNEIQKEIIKTIEDKNLYILKKQSIAEKKKEEYNELKKIEEEKKFPERIENEDDKQLKALIYENEKNVKKQSLDFQHVKNVINISNIFWRTSKIIKILNKYFEENIDKNRLKKEFENVKKNMDEIIKFIDIKRFNSIIKTKYKLNEEDLSSIEIITNYWDENKNKFFSQNQILSNIYEYLFDKVRIIVKTNSVEISQEDKVLIPCKKNDFEENFSIDRKNIYELYDIEWTPLNMLNGTLRDSVDEYEITEKKSLNDIVKLLKSGFSVSLLNMGNAADKNTLFTGNSWNKGLIQYIVDYIQGINGTVKVKEVWELYNSDIDLENGTMSSKINSIKDSKTLKTLFNKYIENIKSDEKPEDVEDYYKHRKHSFLFIHIVCKFKDQTSNLVIIDCPELYTPNQIFREYFKEGISLANLMYTNNVKYIKMYNKTDEQPEIILKKLKNAYYNVEVLNHLKYYFKKLNTDQRLQVKYNKNLDDYSEKNFFINPYLEYKNKIDDDNNCLILPLMNYINEIISNPNKFVLLSIINDNDCQETQNMIDFINEIS